MDRVRRRSLDIRYHGQFLARDRVYYAGFSRIAAAEEADVYALAARRIT